MYQKVKAYIKEHSMIAEGNIILAGVSGGGDSMAMLAMLNKYKRDRFFPVRGTCTIMESVVRRLTGMSGW